MITFIDAVDTTIEVEAVWQYEGDTLTSNNDITVFDARMINTGSYETRLQFSSIPYLNYDGEYSCQSSLYDDTESPYIDDSSSSTYSVTLTTLGI